MIPTQLHLPGLTLSKCGEPRLGRTYYVLRFKRSARGFLDAPSVLNFLEGEVDENTFEQVNQWLCADLEANAA